MLNEFAEESPRKEIWTSEETLETQPYLSTVVEAYDVGKPFTPGLPQWLELFIGLAEGLSAGMSEQRSIQEALDDTAEKWAELIEQAPPEFEYSE